MERDKAAPKPRGAGPAGIQTSVVRLASRWGLRRRLRLLLLLDLLIIALEEEWQTDRVDWAVGSCIRGVLQPGRM